jgi:hypothetical protein
VPRIVTSGREIKARGDDAQHEGVYGLSLHVSEPVVSLITWLPRCSEEATVPGGQVVVKEALFQRRDVCCTRQQTCDFCADPFLSIPAVLQLPAGKDVGRSASLPGSPRGGGRWKNSTTTVTRTERARREGEGDAWKNSTATVARTERARLEGEGAASHLCEEAHRGGDVCARHRIDGGSTMEETCARDSAQAADVRSQRAWCGGEGDCARKRAGSSAEEDRICMEERAFRARWGARRAHGEVDV